MAKNSDKSSIPVAMHKWFGDGEGWAYHPLLKERMEQIVNKVTPHLNTRVTQRKLLEPIELRDGWLVGYAAPDHDCLDPKAVNRQPRDFRFAFVKRRPSESENRDIIKQLEEIIPKKAGENIMMQIHSSYDLAIGENNGVTMTKKMLAFALLFIVIVSAVFVFSTNAPDEIFACASSTFQEGPKRVRDFVGDLGKRPQNKAIQEMGSWLIKWDEVGSDYNVEDGKTPNRFLEFLVFPATERPHHPDVRFLSRLPAEEHDKVKGRAGGSPGWTTEAGREDLNEVLSDLASGLEIQYQNDIDKNNTEALRRQNLELVTKIADEMDYERWLQTSKDFVVTGTNEPNENARNKAIRFMKRIRLDRLDHSVAYGIVKKMYDMLYSWEVKEVDKADIEGRPQFIVYCFFGFLSQENLLRAASLDEDDPLDAERLKNENSWPAAFARRLPEKSLIRPGQTERDFSDPVELLRPHNLEYLVKTLAVRIGSEHGFSEIETLNNIAEAMGDFLSEREIETLRAELKDEKLDDEKELQIRRRLDALVQDLDKFRKDIPQESDSEILNNFYNFFQKNTQEAHNHP